MPASRVQTMRLLLSYHYFKDQNIDEIVKAFGDTSVDLFCDSGAFSALTLGATIPPEEYTEWVGRWRQCFNLVAGPDVIGDPAATERETRNMAAALPGVRVLPTFHVGESWEYLERYVADYGYIALGGMVPYTRQRATLAAWLDRCFKIIPPHVGVHGFGVTTWSLLLRYPFTSVDSSSWVAGFRYGNLSLFNPDCHGFDTIYMSDQKSLLKNMKLLHRYGLRTQDVASATYSRDRLVAACVDAWRLAELYLANRHGAKHAATAKRDKAGITGTAAEEGSASIFLVTSGLGQAPNNPHVIARSLAGAARTGTP